jgi:hypothetical protein
VLFTFRIDIFVAHFAHTCLLFRSQFYFSKVIKSKSLNKNGQNKNILLKRGEKSNKVRSFTSIIAHACISVWKISQRASQNYANIVSIDKYKIDKDFSANIIMKIACSTHAMRVCVWRLSQKVLNFDDMTKSNWII